jgi:hypothetical protein
MKFVLFEMASEARIDLWLHTLMVETNVEQNRLTGVRVYNKSGFHELHARVLIDATGDADVAVRAGAAYQQDVPEAALNATLLFRVAGVDTDGFIADARSAPQKIVLLADPYLRDVKHLIPTASCASKCGIFTTVHIFILPIWCATTFQSATGRNGKSRVRTREAGVD